MKSARERAEAFVDKVFAEASPVVRAFVLVDVEEMLNEHVADAIAEARLGWSTAKVLAVMAGATNSEKAADKALAKLGGGQ